MNAPLLRRRQLQDALERLAHHLHRRGVHAELYLFGRAMVLAYNAREATMDLDTAISAMPSAIWVISDSARRPTSQMPAIKAVMASWATSTTAASDGRIWRRDLRARIRHE